MSKLLVRLTVLFVSLYLILCHICALVYDINLWSHTYTVFFELCVCLCMSAQGNYHCRYMKWTAYGIFFSDLIVSLDEIFDFLPYSWVVFIPVALIAVGLLTTTFLALRHYIKVIKIKRKYGKQITTPTTRQGHTSVVHKQD